MCVHAPCAVGLTGLGVDLTDHRGNHIVSHLSRRRLAVLPHVETRYRHTHDPTRRFDREAVAHDLRDDLLLKRPEPL
jgi:hypothetical protein